MTPAIFATLFLLAGVFFLGCPLFYAISQDQDDPLIRKIGAFTGVAWSAIMCGLGICALWMAGYTIAVNLAI